MDGVEGSGRGGQVDGAGGSGHRGDRFITPGDPPASFCALFPAGETELGGQCVPVGMAEPVGLESSRRVWQAETQALPVTGSTGRPLDRNNSARASVVQGSNPMEDGRVSCDDVKDQL